MSKKSFLEEINNKDYLNPWDLQEYYLINPLIFKPSISQDITSSKPNMFSMMWIVELGVKFSWYLEAIPG